LSDKVILPVDVACERTGLDAETLRGQWGVQELTRRLPDSEPESAFLIPGFMLDSPIPARES
jgi:hypothetical protein